MLLDYEGFDRESNSALSNWFHFNTSFGISGDLGGNFGYGRAALTPFISGRTFAPAASTFWIQGHVRQNGSGSATTQPVWGAMNSGAGQIGFNFTSDLRLFVIYNNTIQVTTALPVVALNAWYFLQMRIVIAGGGAGRVEIWINGANVLNWVGTTNGAGATYNQWFVSNSANNTWSDNMLIYDETGAVPNARTPETRIFTELPTGAGAATAWTPSAGANYQNVDEQPNDGDTTYNSAATFPLDDLYAFPAGTVPAASIVYFVAAEYDCRKDDAGTNDVDALIRSGGTTYPAGDVKTLTATWQRFRSIWSVDPATGIAWTVAGANATEIGVRRVA